MRPYVNVPQSEFDKRTGPDILPLNIADMICTPEMRYIPDEVYYAAVGLYNTFMVYVYGDTLEEAIEKWNNFVKRYHTGDAILSGKE